jgi:type I restriction enzyme S subunit
VDVRPGYKQTDVGTIPNDWEVKRLGELASVSAGGTPSRSIAKYWNGDIPWITTSELDFGTVSQADQFISKEGLNNSAAKILSPGTLLMALYGQGKTRGKVAVLGIEAATNQACAAISLSRGVSSAFVLHFLGSRYEAIRNLSNTGNQENLNSSLVRSIPILLPPKSEQETIAEALSDGDALTESLEQLLAKKRQIKQGAMQELLTGKKRLPGFENKADFRQTEVGTIPEDWEVKTLGEIGESLIGLTYRPSDVRSHGILVLRSSNIQEGQLCFDDNVFVDMKVPDRIMVRAGDILICVRNGSRELIGKCTRIDERADGMTFGAFMAVFRTSAHRFVYHQFQSAVIKRQIREHLGATINQITNKSLNSFVVPLPRQEAEQEAIAEALTDIEAELATLEAEVAKASEIKQGMMQELLTGRIRLV